MGIPHYFHVISQNYPGILTNDLKNIPDHFFIDFNGMIHTAAQFVLKEFAVCSDEIEMPDEAISEAICIETWARVEASRLLVAPKVCTYICTDGVAPLAKINQQRKRRYLSHFQKTPFAGGIDWDRNAISPHTEFMRELGAFILNRINNLPDGTTCYYSDSQEPGEGEHKIFAKIAELSSHDHVCVHGLDADLIMLALCSHKRHITLMRESNEGQMMFLDIDALREGLLKEVQVKYSWPVNISEGAYSDAAKNTIESYIILCFILGNDFLPHMSSLSLKKNGHTRILQAAGRAFTMETQALVDHSKGKINSEFLLTVFEILAKDEDCVMIDLVNEYHHKRPMPGSDKTELYPLYNKDPLVTDILMSPKTWRSLYYKSLFASRDTALVKNACKSFLTGIIWTYAYYKKMQKDPMFVYPYGYAPTLLDLSNYLSVHGQEFSEMLGKWKNATFRGSVDPTAQLMIMLPPQSIHLVPQYCHKYITDPKFGCAHMFVRGYKVQTFMKTYLWECNPVLPGIDVETLEACMGVSVSV